MANLLNITITGRNSVAIRGCPYMFPTQGDESPFGIMPVAARWLMVQGLDQHTRVQATRKGFRASVKERTLAEWASLTEADPR